MTRIQIPVQKIGHRASPFVVLEMLAGGFTLGLVAGVFLANPTIFDTHMSAGINIASVGESKQSTDDIFLTTREEVIPITNTSYDDENAEAILGPSEDSEVPTGELLVTQENAGEVAGASDTVNEASDAENATQRERLSREIAQIKDASVAIIVQFNQNCGSWADACALPYSKALEQNNARYDALARELDSLRTTP